MQKALLYPLDREISKLTDALLHNHTISMYFTKMTFVRPLSIVLVYIAAFPDGNNTLRSTNFENCRNVIQVETTG